ncbi:carboxypeptidase-like regulatory domain-containing protein [Pontibacter harenae]|uniref:carboxypeptidase-like regulatory domain-containing protein n=1 Tax=Pontibacter harenae TaxID=2894083 RepID=UPI001E5E12BE|nr:carboxypeptidase-like regulatory domain-containing protein [Pontibacter harenae]MCC9166637.1 carboxypeptidase-like regulatory domain-containing protein [Pontibacter harenae]
MKKSLLTLICFLFFFGAALAHNGSIRGGVFSLEGNTPLTGATVVLLNQNQSTTTDVFGTYTFTNL